MAILRKQIDIWIWGNRQVKSPDKIHAVILPQILLILDFFSQKLG